MLFVTKYEAPWCAKCKQLVAPLQKLVEDGSIELHTVDVDVNPQAAKDAGVRTLPTLIVDNPHEYATELTRGTDMPFLYKLVEEYKGV